MSKRVLLFLVPLWLAFCACGLLVHHVCQDAPINHLGWVDVAGYDSDGYLTHFTHPSGLFESRLRHPLVGAVTLPITLVGLMVSHRVGRENGELAVIGCFAVIGALTCWLLWLLLKKTGATRSSRVAAVALWLSFAHVWLLGGLAESFSISMAIMLGVLLMVAYGVRDVRAWGGAALLAGSVTITNVVKPIAAWISAAGGWRFLRGLSRRTVLLSVAALVLLPCVAAGVLVAKWVFLHGNTVSAGVSSHYHELFPWFDVDFSLGHRLWLAWNAFWCEPMMLRESVIGQGPILHPYKTIFPHILGATVLVLCVWSAIRNFRLPVVRAALSMVAFDLLIHVVIGWGIKEGQIYCGHWFWIIPLLVALLPSRTAYLTVILAVGIAINNLCIVFGR